MKTQQPTISESVWAQEPFNNSENLDTQLIQYSNFKNKLRIVQIADAARLTYSI